MQTVKRFTLGLLCVLFLPLALSAADLAAVGVGIVSFSECMDQSKMGQSQQQAFESMRHQMVEIMEKNEKELNDLQVKINDSDYVDSLPPESVGQLKMKLQNLYQERARYEQQYYQALSQGNAQLWSSMQEAISLAAAKVANQRNLQLILNEVQTFYFSNALDITKDVIVEMDSMFGEQAEMPKTPADPAASHG